MDALAEIRGIYFDECDEFTGLLEGYLAAMSEGRATSEDINGAFRAVHSIKGGAGAFGLSDLVAFAHRFEACLDALRSGRVALDNAPVNVLLQAGDVLSSLIAASRDETSLPVDPVLIAALEAFCGGAPAPAPAAGAVDMLDAVEPAPDIGPKAVPEPEAAPTRTLIVRIKPEADMFRRAVEPLMIFDALRALGSIEVACDTAAIPPLGVLDPITCHLSWIVTLDTDASVTTVVESLDSWLADDEYSVAEPTGEPADAGEAARVAAPAGAPAEAAAAAAHGPAQIDTPGPVPAGEPAHPPGGQSRRSGGGTIRVDLDRIDKLMNLVGEIVITQSMLTERATMLPKREAAVFVDALFSLNRQTRELQDNVMAVRAQPVKVVFQRLPRLVRELERTLGKRAELKLSGEDTEVDKTIVEELADPLIHMIRNSMDHGLEMPEDRIAAGKSPEGTIRVSAEHRGSRILISISDDGRGINRDRLIDKAKARGLIGPDAELSPEEADNLIFHPGLSTAAAVTDVSGRGVGMDVVRRNVEALGGRITVESNPGRGCRFTLGLPLTLAVLDGMIVRAGTERFVFPLSSIVETMQLDPKAVEALPGQRSVLRLRGEVAPLIRLRDLLGIRAIGNEPNIVIVETDSIPRLAIAVDEIVGQQQVVVKNLESSFRRVEGVSAATILGDGLVALILDVDALPVMAHANNRRPAIASDMHGAA